MTTKQAALAAAIHGTMPLEPSPAPVPALVDLPLRLYCDSMAEALLGTAPPAATPPGAPGVLTAAYPSPVAPTPGPHVAAASNGTLPATTDAVLCQIHVDASGNAHVFNGTVWKKLKFDP
jgi:hypothetical protein